MHNLTFNWIVPDLSLLLQCLRVFHAQRRTRLKDNSTVWWSFTFFIKSVRVFLDCLLDGGLVAVSPLHLGSSVVTGCLCSTAGTALTMELHQFAHCDRKHKKLLTTAYKNKGQECTGKFKQQDVKTCKPALFRQSSRFF